MDDPQELKNLVKKFLKILEMISLPISKLKLVSGQNQAIIEQNKFVIKSSEMSEKVLFRRSDKVCTMHFCHF